MKVILAEYRYTLDLIAHARQTVPSNSKASFLQVVNGLETGSNLSNSEEKVPKPRTAQDWSCSRLRFG